MSATPAQIGPYQVLRELGRGGMGVVFLAHDTRLDRQVALKALPEHLAADADRLARFQREAKVLASLNHPNIAAIYGLEHAGSQQFLVLEFVDGDTLEARLGRGAMPVDEAIDAARHIAAALEAAHEKGVIHRDLKPGNVMVSSEGVVKVLDFGLARNAETGASTSGGVLQADSPTIQSPAPINSPTIPGAIMGTAGYMSPEQARGKVVDKRSDIFSFGCVLYEMMTGAGPFPGETVTDSLGAILHREPDWSMLPPGTPPRIRELLANCLAKDRKNRLHDIGDARLQLERAATGVEWIGDEPSSQRGTLRANRSWRAASLVGAAIGGMALASIGWLLARGAVQAGSASPESSEVIRVSIDSPPNVVLFVCGISPDGRTVILFGDDRSNEIGATRFHAFLRTLESFSLTELPASELVEDMCFSPDGKSYAMLSPISVSSARQRIMRGPIDGSAPPASVAELPIGSRGDCLAWPTEDEIYALQRGVRMLTPISVKSGTVGQPVPFTVPGTNAVVKWISPLPGGRRFLADCSAYGERGFDQFVGVLDLDSRSVSALVNNAGCPRYSPTGHLLFTRLDALLAAPFDLDGVKITGPAQVLATGLRTLDCWSNASYALSRNGTLAYLPGGVQGTQRTLVTIDADGHVEPWFGEGRSFSFVIPPCMSPDGTRAAAVVTNSNGIDEVWLIEPATKQMRRLVGLPHADAAPLDWMPDGEHLIFSRFGDPVSEDGVYLVRVDGTEPPVLVAAGQGRKLRHDIGTPLPDGSAIILDMLQDGASKMLLVPVPAANGPAPSSAHRLLMSSPSIFAGAAVSPDGRLLAYSMPDSEIEQVFVCTLAAEGQLGPRMQASSDGGKLPRWRRNKDGQLELLFVDPRGRGVSVAVTPEPRLRLGAPALLADGSRVDLGFPIGEMLPDGRLFAVQGGADETQPTSARLVLNFDEELKRKMNAASADR